MISKQIKLNVFAYNKNMTDEYFGTLSIVQKFKLMHPVDRYHLANTALKEGFIDRAERSEIPVGKGWEDLIK